MKGKLTTGAYGPLILMMAALLFTACCAQKPAVSTSYTPSPYTSVESTQPAEPDEAALAAERAKAEEMARQKALQEEMELFINKKIYFDFDRSELKADAKAVLEAKAKWLRANPDAVVKIEGHCDERGTNEYNLALGDRRAQSTKDYLVALGIAESRISTVSYGEERPADMGHTEEAWAKNRRCEFLLS